MSIEGIIAFSKANFIARREFILIFGFVFLLKALFKSELLV